MTTNYFKRSKQAIDPDTGRILSVPELFFFDDRSPATIREAFDRASGDEGKLSVYRLPKIVGPWSDVAIVGAGIGELAGEPN